MYALIDRRVIVSDITSTCGDCSGKGCGNCDYKGTITIVED